ncbi:MAG TPA: hypothetical protein PLA91_00830 [Bacillota bacterium]|nr:hypothetical protein [Bacillota bacterium]
MTSLKDFLAEERVSLQELSTGFAPEYREQVMRSFIESPLLPGGSFNLLLLAEGAPTTELLQNLALAAYDRFVSSYLEQVAAYADQTAAELAGGEWQALSGRFTGPEQLDRLLELFAGARSDDPVLEWFVNEGAALLNDMRRRLAVKDVDGLAALIRQLEYYSLFFTSADGEVESYSFIIDIPERAVSELAELGLLVAAGETESFRGVVLDPESFNETWDQNAFQLVDWQKSVLRMASKEAGNIARQLADILQESAKPADPAKTSRIPFTQSFQPWGEPGFWLESVKVEIKVIKSNREGTDEQVGDTSSDAAA